MSYKSTQTFVPLLESEPMEFRCFTVDDLRKSLYVYYFKSLASYIGFDVDDDSQVVWRGVSKPRCGVINPNNDYSNTWYVFEKDIVSLGGTIDHVNQIATIPNQLTCDYSNPCTRCYANKWSVLSSEEANNQRLKNQRAAVKQTFESMCPGLTMEFDQEM